MVVSTSVYQLIRSNIDVLETNILLILAMNSRLFRYKHYGLWQSMDTIRVKELFKNLISKNNVPWLRKISNTIYL